MQDRFKFRLWDITQRKFIKVTGINYYDDTDEVVVHYDEDRFETVLDEGYLKACFLEQSTGLKDKYGKLIYEGDIVQVDSMVYYSEPLTLVIRFHNGAFMAGDRHIDNNSIFMEIIGNIHENPELMEGK